MLYYFFNHLRRLWWKRLILAICSLHIAYKSLQVSLLIVIFKGSLKYGTLRRGESSAIFPSWFLAKNCAFRALGLCCLGDSNSPPPLFLIIHSKYTHISWGLKYWLVACRFWVSTLFKKKSLILPVLSHFYPPKNKEVVWIL